LAHEVGNGLLDKLLAGEVASKMPQSPPGLRSHKEGPTIFLSVLVLRFDVEVTLHAFLDSLTISRGLAGVLWLLANAGTTHGGELGSLGQL
jgi:hypothetical protein